MHNGLFKLARIFLLSVLLALASGTTFSQVRLPQIIRDSMILQRDAKINIWGWASPGERVTIAFNGNRFNASTSAEGKWRAVLPAMKAGGPYTMSISGKNKIILGNILIGDVWLCAGQSNMVHQMNIHDVRYAKDIAEANFSEIRQLWIPTRTSLKGPNEDLPPVFWKSAVGEDVRPFSAVAYFFARKIYELYHIPIGIINASVGGTPIEAWTSEEGFREFPSILKVIEQNKDTAYLNRLSRRAMSRGTGQTRRVSPDKGLSGPIQWYSPDFIPKKWRNINIPGYWEDQGIKDLNGVVWYRKMIDLPVSMAGKPARVFLGRIVDADVLYINGRQVGQTTYQYPQRRYNVPAGVLRAGKNLFVIKVTNQAGKGGFVPDKPYCIFSGNDTVDLKGYWQYKVGQVFEPGAPLPGGINAQNQPGSLYNAMVAPYIDYSIKGILWYQGESNESRPKEYSELLKSLIRDWRNKFKKPEAPFIYAQLPNYMDVNYLPSESNWAELRESQLKALSLPFTAMTVNIDLGEWNDIHPDDKKDVGERMALAARKIAYHDSVVYSGPIYRDYTIEGNKIIISFTNVGSGLVSNDGEELSEFAVAGENRKFVWAHARIEGDKVIVWSDEVSEPKYARYAWADNPDNPNLYNREGLPASPFRTY